MEDSTTRSRVTPSEPLTPGITSGCASIPRASLRIGMEYMRCSLLTLLGFSTVSCVYAPCRRLLPLLVSTGVTVDTACCPRRESATSATRTAPKTQMIVFIGVLCMGKLRSRCGIVHGYHPLCFEPVFLVVPMGTTLINPDKKRPFFDLAVMNLLRR